MTLQTEVEKARVLEGLIEAESPGAEPAAAGTHAMDELARPAHLDEGSVFGSFLPYTGKTKAAVRGYEYWNGDQQPWRHSVDKAPITDAAVITTEEQHKLSAEADDQMAETADQAVAAATHATKLRCCGVRIDFLLGPTHVRARRVGVEDVGSGAVPGQTSDRERGAVPVR